MHNTTISFFALFFFLSLAFAHITPAPQQFVAGTYGATSLRIGHGCSGSPTTRLDVKIPNSLISVRAREIAGWTISYTRKSITPTSATGRLVNTSVDTITLTPTDPLADNVFQVIDLSFFVRPTQEIESTLTTEEQYRKFSWRQVPIQILQTCSDNKSNDWAQIQNPHDPTSEEPEEPAPVLFVREPLAGEMESSSFFPEAVTADTKNTAEIDEVKGLATAGLVIAVLSFVGIVLGFLVASKLWKLIKATNSGYSAGQATNTMVKV
jgi:periplasmic copper chaperone A